MFQGLKVKIHINFSEDNFTYIEEYLERAKPIANSSLHITG